MRTSLKILFSALAAFGALAARAAPASAADFNPAFATTRIGGFIDVWPRDNAFRAAFGVEGQFAVTANVLIDFDATFAYARVDGGFLGNTDSFAYGNPSIGAHYAKEVNNKLWFFVGGRLTIPVLADPELDVNNAALATSSIRGYVDLDRLLPGSMAIRAFGGIELNPVRPIYVRAVASPTVFVRVNDRYGILSDDAELVFETYGEFEYRLPNGFGFGARLQAAFLSYDFFNRDHAQVVAEPFLGLTPKRRGFYLRAGFPLALDNDLGFGFDRGPNQLAAVRVALGGQLDAL